MITEPVGLEEPQIQDVVVACEIQEKGQDIDRSPVQEYRGPKDAPLQFEGPQSNLFDFSTVASVTVKSAMTAQGEHWQCVCRDR